jgi:2-oxoglutarate dehydrogenase E2 component (dihydrolipoamide succinyltransferase)
MGESIAEGTVSKWLKQLGELVQRDEAILEISTDKVDAEIPSPSQGVLVEILVQEGETVEVGTTVAVIDPDAEVGAREAAADSATLEEPAPEAEFPEDAGPEAATAADDSPGDAGIPAVQDLGAGISPEEVAGAATETAEDRLRTRSTPVVRRIAEEQDVDLRMVRGTGHAGRVTKEDIMAFIEAREEKGPQVGAGVSAAPPPLATPAPGSLTTPVPAPAPTGVPSELWQTFYSQVQHPEFPIRAADRVEAMDKIRRLTAEHMVLAKRVSPHVHSFIEIDFTRVDTLRRINKARWEEQGIKVSFTAFVVWACSRVLREFPMLNGTISGNNLIFRGNVNIGMAVDLDPGLIVPVIHDADELSLVGIGKRLVDLAERARSRRLNPEEIQGATFSITNPGVLGTMAGTPVIPKGTNGILGTGAIEKRVVVVEDPETGTDSMAIRKRSIFTLGYDHRMVDGADAARFLARLRELMENFPDDA